MIGSMAVLHVSEAELARDLHAILEQVRQGGEVVVEQDQLPVAIMKPMPQQPGRLLSESIAIAKQRENERGHAAVLDPDFADDVEDLVSNRQMWNPTSWD